MGQIHNIEKLTDCKFLNLYHLNATSVHNTPVSVSYTHLKKRAGFLEVGILPFYADTLREL